MKNSELYSSLKKRGLNLSRLAELARVSRCHLSEVLANKPRRGLHTRRKLLPYLIPEEIKLLGWDTDYENYLAEKKNYEQYLAEQSSMKNTVPEPTTQQTV